MGTESLDTAAKTEETYSDSRRRSWLPVFIGLAASFLVIEAILAAVSVYPVERYWQEALKEQITRSLTEKAGMFSSRVGTDRSRNVRDITYEEAHLAGARATVIDTNGKVISDSEVPLTNLDQEGTRPEFVTALQGSTGVAVRSRSHFGAPVIYVAVPVAGGAVRLASPMSDLEIASSNAQRTVLLGILGSGLFALAASAFMAWRLTRA
jgi:hypothetical protein